MSTNGTVPFIPNYRTCDEVTPRCPVSATLYGDYFSEGASYFFAICFGILLLAQAYLGYKAKTWSYAVYLWIGTLFELVGYAARIAMAKNPWNYNAMVAQLAVLVLAPTLVAAAMSITFKHLVLHYDPDLSPIRPKWYPWIFVGSDILSIAIQTLGAGLAGAATSGKNEDMDRVKTLQDISSGMLIAGVAFQVANMIACGLFMLYYWKLYRTSRQKVESTSGDSDHGVMGTQQPIRGKSRLRLRHDRVKIFIWAIAIAFIAVVIRCIYR